MSSPLLATSPTVQLEVNPNRELEASVVLSPDPTNALRVNPNGLWQKTGQRRYPWQVSVAANPITATTAALNLNQVLTWTTEVYDPDGLFNPTTAPTQIVAPADGRYFSHIQGFGTFSANTDLAVGQLVILKNALTLVAATDVTVGNRTVLPSGAVTFWFSQSAYLDAVAGDFFEAYWRWYNFVAGPPSSSPITANWGGGAITT